ncbi:hypothetical protein Tco_0814595 [Tanacetum coccineum]
MVKDCQHGNYKAGGDSGVRVKFLSMGTAEEVQGKEQISTDEKVAHKLNDKEMARAAAREEQERIDFEKALEVRNITEAYQVFEYMLKGFDREDPVTLWSLVKERFRSAEPTEDMEKALWVEMKRLFEPDKDDVLWKLQKYMHDPLTWRLYDTCRVHHVSSTRGLDIYMLTENDYPLSTAVIGLMLSRRLQAEEESQMARDLVMKIFIEANKPRS